MGRWHNRPDRRSRRWHLLGTSGRRWWLGLNETRRFGGRCCRKGIACLAERGRGDRKGFVLRDYIEATNSNTMTE